MQLYLTPRSPFARKVRICLLEKEIDHELVQIDLAHRDAAFWRLNPIGKIPVLVHGDLVIPDSTVICEHLEDHWPTPPMYEADRTRCRILDELGDAVGDQAVVAFFARQRGDVDAAARALGVADRVLDHVVDLLAQGDWPEEFGIAEASLLSGLGYLELRHGPGWRGRHLALADWAEGHRDRPSVELTRPTG